MSANDDRTVDEQKPLQSTDTWRQPTADEIANNERLYEIAYDEAKRAIDDQTLELGNIRTRAVAYLAFTGAAAAFLAGTGINSGHRSSAFYALAIVAYVLALLVIVLVALVLSPWSAQLYKRVEAGILVGQWIERDVPTTTRADMLRELALTYDDWRRENETTLMRIRRMYVAAIAVGGIELIAWSVLVWIAR